MKWKIEKAGEFEAKFGINKMDMEVVYDSTGTKLVSEFEIKEVDLEVCRTIK